MILFRLCFNKIKSLKALLINLLVTNLIRFLFVYRGICSVFCINIAFSEIYIIIYSLCRDMLYTGWPKNNGTAYLR